MNVPGAIMIVKKSGLRAFESNSKIIGKSFSRYERSKYTFKSRNRIMVRDRNMYCFPSCTFVPELQKL